jgi:hypothetical protein
MAQTITALLLREIEGFLRVSGMAPTRFGLEAMGDGALVSQLRAGSRSLTVKNADKVLEYIRKNGGDRTVDAPVTQ